MSEKIALLKELKAECLSCTACRLCKGDDKVKQPHVFGRGNASAKIMVVGQNPGYNETIQGKPFVGAAGKNFDEFLCDVLGLERKHIYITNTVKCYSPKNRAPYWDEIDACRHFLKREIEIVRPKVVLALGNYALQYLTKTTGMSKCHGQMKWSEEFNVHVFPLYHPSPMNMNKSTIKQATTDDFVTLKEFLEELENEEADAESNAVAKPK